MHDWILVDIEYLWSEKECLLRFKNRKSEIEEVNASGVELLNIPHKEEWGPSVSVNEVTESDLSNGLTELMIEMQSGDILTIHASSFKGL